MVYTMGLSAAGFDSFGFISDDIVEV